jgi:23S rRNA pseudoU1915 N3-methylase RlmH
MANINNTILMVINRTFSDSIQVMLIEKVTLAKRIQTNHKYHRNT